LAGRLARASHIENEEVVPVPVPQSTWMLLFPQRTSQQLVQKKASQGLDRSLIQRGEKAAERRTGRQTVAPTERHERVCPGLQPFVKAFQRPFAADGIAEQHGDKINHLVTPEAATSKAHLLCNGCKHPLVL
jgi:hypothetical protein